MLPVSKVTWGVPVTVTDSEKAIVTAIVSPAVYVPSVVDADTDDTVGTTPSTTIVELSARLLPDGMEKLDILLLASSDKVPADKAIVFTLRSVLTSPDCTVYVPEAELALLMLEMVTCRSVSPVSRLIFRFPPESVTASEKFQ